MMTRVLTTQKTLLPLLLFFGAFGCNTPVEPVNVGENAARLLSDGVEFTLRLERARFRQSDTLRVTFEVWNRANSEKTFGFLNQQQLGVEIQRLNGEILQQWPALFQPAGSGFVLQPNQRRTLVLQALLRDWRTGNPLPTGRFLAKRVFVGRQFPTREIGD